MTSGVRLADDLRQALRPRGPHLRRIRSWPHAARPSLLGHVRDQPRRRSRLDPPGRLLRWLPRRLPTAPPSRFLTRPTGTPSPDPARVPALDRVVAADEDLSKDLLGRPGHLAAVLLCGATAMVTLRPRAASQSRLHRGTYGIAATLGRARVLFSAFFAATATAAFAESPENLLILYLFGGLLLWTTPLQSVAERLVALGRREEKQGLVVEEIAQPRTAFLIAPDGSLRAGQRVLRGEEDDWDGRRRGRDGRGAVGRGCPRSRPAAEGR